MCQNVPSLDEAVSPWRGLLRGPQTIKGRRGPSLIIAGSRFAPSV